MGARVLVAGIGNVFLGDDGFGVELAQRLARRAVPDGVAVLDVGIRSLHLAYELLDPPELLVVVDAVRRGERPGTLTLIQPTDLEQAAPETPVGHGGSLGAAMAALRTLGGTPPAMLLVGCEPDSLEERVGLSQVVQAALPGAEEMVRSLVAHHLVPAAAGAADRRE